ncbi:MOSC domain protein [Dictyocaulus viviparus]|uniref:MOSC domain protein n=1 Tax=Dictyocaulus viviparus TaxID=29172 RepID=A0A0D8XI02_DICVI|nr:MOSC domain protein [Dictyocaulus viviparus]
MPYLDHAGAALSSEQQLRDVFEFLLSTPLANPHSNHMTSATTKLMIEDARLRLEHGTQNYTAICTLTKGFVDLKRYGGIQKINNNTKQIALAAHEMLKNKTHWNGISAVKIYGWRNTEMQGPIIAFNLLRVDGSYTDDTITKRVQNGKECGDSKDIVECRPTGALRISFGRQSTLEDVLALDQMLNYCFLGLQSSIQIVYPMKICDYTAVITCLIVYPIDEANTTLTLYDVNSLQSTIHMSLLDDNERKQCSVVCLNTVPTTECSINVSKWISSIVELPDCKLRRIQKDSKRSLSNEAPYLVVNEASIKILADIIGLSTSETIDRFRPNIVVKGIPPFIEDTANIMRIDDICFEIIKKCTRCEMICVNPTSGLKEPQLIVALRDFRKREKVVRASPTTYSS